MTLEVLDGRTVRRPLRLAADVAIVGSGPAGSAVAARLAAAGLRVVVLEEGHLHAPSDFVASGVRAMATLYRDLGTSLTLGRDPMPFLQGRAVGGTSVVNGSICWSFPEDVHRAWLAADPSLETSLDWASLQASERALARRLNVHPTPAATAGEKSARMARGAEALGWAHRPILRNVDGCRGAGRCLQGCPHGARLSMDRSLLLDAARDGARIVGGVRVDRVTVDRRGASGVRGVSAGGAPVEVRVWHGVVLAASAILTPVLLRRSGLTDGPVGDHLAGHPGVSVTGRYDEPVHPLRGATQGHEVTGLRGEGMKLETLGFDASILASRIPGVGRALAERLERLDHHLVFGAALRTAGRGTVRPGWLRPRVTLPLTEADRRLARRGVRRLAELLLASGAREVWCGVPDVPVAARSVDDLAALDAPGPLPAMSVTHLFGTARMGSDPSGSVVRPDFRHHRVAGLWVADSSVFPTSLGVNPMLPILAVADRCGAAILAG